MEAFYKSQTRLTNPKPGANPKPVEVAAELLLKHLLTKEFLDHACSGGSTGGRLRNWLATFLGRLAGEDLQLCFASHAAKDVGSALVESKLPS